MTDRLDIGSRCVSGKATLFATLTNAGTAAADARVTSTFGTAEVSGLAAGKSTSVTFATRSANLSAGSLTAMTTTEVNGTRTQGTVTADDAARSCG